MITVRRFVFNPLGEHTYLTSDEDGVTAIIDPGCFLPGEKERLLAALSEGGSGGAAAILVTHAHFDHIYGVRELQDELGLPVWMNPDDVPMLDFGGVMAAAFDLPAPDTSFKFNPVRDGDTVRVGKMAFKVIATPGHAPGSVCFLEESEKIMFTGDTLFAGTIGRTNLPLASYDSLIVSIMDKLMGLDGDIRIFPGHGHDSTIGHERITNPFLEPWGEAEED